MFVHANEKYCDWKVKDPDPIQTEKVESDFLQPIDVC